MSLDRPSQSERSNETAQRITRVIELSLSTYTTRAERVAMRCALGDAAAICDIIAENMLAHAQRRAKGRKVPRLVRDMAGIAKNCGDAIYAVRDQISLERITSEEGYRGDDITKELS